MGKGRWNKSSCWEIELDDAPGQYRFIGSRRLFVLEHSLKEIAMLSASSIGDSMTSHREILAKVQTSGHPSQITSAKPLR
jgi:hypothetical protein